MSRLLDQQNKPGHYSHANRCHLTKEMHSVAPHRTRQIGKGDFLTNERADISDKAFPIGQFPGNHHLRRGAAGRLDLDRGNRRRPR